MVGVHVLAPLPADVAASVSMAVVRARQGGTVGEGGVGLEGGVPAHLRGATASCVLTKSSSSSIYRLSSASGCALRSVVWAGLLGSRFIRGCSGDLNGRIC